MFAHNISYENALSFSRFDSEHFLSPQSPHSFELEGRVWPSAEHYYQFSKFNEGAYSAKILFAHTAKQAHKLGNAWWRPKRNDFKAVRKTLMTRALYSKTIQNPEIKEALLATADQLILENSAYEHFWGIGRDQRGNNHLGTVWMDIRAKLTAQQADTASDLSRDSSQKKAPQ